MSPNDHRHLAGLQIRRMSFKTKRSKPSNCHFLGNVHVPDGEMQKMEYEIASIKSERRREKNYQPSVMGAWGIKKMQKIVALHPLSFHVLSRSTS